MALLNVNGIKIDVEVCGKGFPLLLIHGLWLDKTMWHAEEMLHKFANANKVIAYDCRGHGKSDKPISYTLADHVADAFALADILGIAEFDLMGVSMGSYISQGMAVAMPERIRKLVLVTPKSNGATSSLKQVLSENAELLKTMDDRQRIDFMNRLAIHDSEAFRKYPDFLESKLEAKEMEAAAAALRDFDFREDLVRITAKTLIISGKFDRLNPPAEGRICAERIAGAEFVIMEKSAHAPIIEEPEAFFQLVNKFITD
ncbi:MAG: alpha/beta hydrolase [Steroidobacter sp.]